MIATLMNASIRRLHVLCDIIPPLLAALDETELAARPASGGWSKKQILGHLIDSAANNHHRFIRGQFEDTPHIIYDQNAWNDHGYYCKIESSQLIRFWESYNRQLLALSELIPPVLLHRTVDTGGSKPFTIAYLIADYVAHLEHHLRQMVDY